MTRSTRSPTRRVPTALRTAPLAAALAATLGLALGAAPAAAQDVAPGPVLAPPAPATPPAAPSAAGPVAPPAATARATLIGWFHGFEFVPTERHYRALGDALGPALISIVEDPAEHPLVRARALSAMTYATDAATEATLAAVLEDPAAESLLRRKAALALAERQGAGAIDRVVQAHHTAGDDVALREACARALRAIGPAAHPARDALLRVETNATVRGLLGADKHIGLD